MFFSSIFFVILLMFSDVCHCCKTIHKCKDHTCKNGAKTITKKYECSKGLYGNNNHCKCPGNTIFFMDL